MAQVVGGRYQLIAHLGGGARSEISLAKTDAKAGAPALSVLKRLKLGVDAEADVVAQLGAEALLAMRLKHPNIVAALEMGQDSDGPFLALEYLEGQTLARLRSRAHRRGAGVPRGIALHIVMAVSAGLAYAHELQDEAGKRLKIVHGDLQPENILVTYAGTTKVIDFSAPAAAGKPAAGAPRPNVAYMAPEQAKSAVILDGRVDVFAAGVILWELLAGKRLWEGMSEAAVLTRLADDKPLPSLRSVVPDMPEALDAICAQALAKVRDDRFDSAADLREAIEKVTNAPDAKDLKTTTAQVAELVTSLFEDEREKMRTTVDRALMGPVDAAKALPQIRPLPPTSSNKFVDVETDPNLWVGAAPRAAPSAPGSAPSAPASAPAAPVIDVLRVEQAPSPDRRFALLVGGAVLIAFAGVAVVAITHKSDQPDTTPRPMVTARPTATATTEPSAPAEPEEVTIELTVKPPTAKLTVDGVKTMSNPHRVKVVRGRFAHEVKAEAEGFEPRTMTVTFDRDRSIDIVLVPKPVSGGFLPPRPTSSASTGSPPSPAPAKDRDAQ